MRRIFYIFLLIGIFGSLFLAINTTDVKASTAPSPAEICEVIGPQCNARGWNLCESSQNGYVVVAKGPIYSCVGQWKVRAFCMRETGWAAARCICNRGSTEVEWCEYGCARNNNATQCLTAPIAPGQPATGQPATGQPATGQPATGQPATGQPAPSVGIIEIRNPLEADTFQELIQNIINLIFTIALLIAPAMIIVGAFYFLTAGGNPQQVETGKKIILYTIIGFVIIMLSWGMIELLREAFGVRNQT